MISSDLSEINLGTRKITLSSRKKNIEHAIFSNYPVGRFLKFWNRNEQRKFEKKKTIFYFLNTICNESLHITNTPYDIKKFVHTLTQTYFNFTFRNKRKRRQNILTQNLQKKKCASF